MTASLADATRNEIEIPARLSQPARFLMELLAVGEQAPLRPADQVEQFLGWSKRNKIPLKALADRSPLWLLGDPAFVAALDAEEAWYRTQRNEYLRVREAWRARGIDCLMIKPAGNPPSFPHTSDNIDILVRPDDGVAARETLREMGYVEIRNVEEPQKFLFRRFHDGQCVSAIHVHERIAWFVGFLDDALVWERARPASDDPAVLIPSPEDAILINLAHACYENKELRMVEVVRVRHALTVAGDALDWSYMDSIATQRGWLDGLAFMLLIHAEAERTLFGETLVPTGQLERYEAIVREDAPVRQRLDAIRAAGIADLPLDLSYLFCKRLYYRKILRDPAQERTARLRDVAATLIWGVKLKSGLRPQPGMVVSLSGPDGSGKTAHAESLVAAIRLCELRADYVWSRGGSSGLFRNLQRLRRTAPAEQLPESDPIERRKGRLQQPVVRFGWSWLVAADQIATTVRRVSLPAWRGRIVVTDRCAYDTAVEMDASLPADARWSRLAIDAMLRLTPTPDLGFVLDVSHETARARKPGEIWHTGWHDERQRYQELALTHRLRLLSTEGTFERSNDPLIHDVLMAFMARYETRLNGLLYSNPSQKNVPDQIWAEEVAR
jgi:thymidylate kinase